MTTEPSDYQCSDQHLPQLPEFNNTEWMIDTAIENGDLELMSSSTPFLLYVTSCAALIINKSSENYRS